MNKCKWTLDHVQRFENDLEITSWITDCDIIAEKSNQAVDYKYCPYCEKEIER